MRSAFLTSVLPLVATLALPAHAWSAKIAPASSAAAKHATTAALLKKVRKPYRTKRMRLSYRVGDLINRHWPGVKPASRIPYFSSAQRKPYEVTVQDGKLYYQGEVLNTAHQVDGLAKNTFIFVMDRNGTMYAAPNGGTELNIHHSSFLRGRKVAAAGTLTVVDGVIQKITNKSGHYGVRSGKMRQMLAELEGRGVNTESVDTSFKKRPSKTSIMVHGWIGKAGRLVGIGR